MLTTVIVLATIIYVFGCACLLLVSSPTWRCLQEGAGDGRLFILIGGFGQPVSAWKTFCQALNPGDAVYVLTRRHLENRLWTILPVSLVPFFVQKWVLLSHIAIIKWRRWPKFTLVAHSAGGLLADKVAEYFANRVEAVHLLNSYPLGQRGALLSSKTFWRDGGLRTVPNAIMACILFWRGLRPSKSVSNSLFASNQLDQVELRAYHASLVPDSVLQFLAMVLWAKGTGLLRLRQRGNTIPVSITYSAIDPIFKPEDQGVMAERLDAHLSAFHPNTPHCWWLNNEPEVLEHNLAVLRAAIYPERHSVQVDTTTRDGHDESVTLH